MKSKILSHPLPYHQRGIVAVTAVILLITAVIFALSQTISNNGTASTDNKQQLDSTAALFLAESGIERAKGILYASVSSGSVSNTSCSNISTSGSFALGRGNFKYDSATSEPSNCSGVGCTKCTVEVTGTVGSSTRTLKYGMNLVPTNGVSGSGTKVSIALQNTYSVPATVLFVLAWQRQGQGGNANATICTGCNLQWYELSSSGNNSIGSMGSASAVAANSVSSVLTQTLDLERNYAEVGTFLPGFTTAPTVLGSFWDDINGSVTSTVDIAAKNTGLTNSGVANVGICPLATTSTGTKQTCNSWCNNNNFNADTLVFGVSARSTSNVDQFTKVKFNTDTTATQPQNIDMKPIAHFPNTDSTIATGEIYAEIWKTYNPAYPPQSAGPGATSFSRAVYGTIGANITGTIGASVNSVVGASFTGKAGTKSGTTINVSTTLTVGSMCTNCTLSKGDVITGGFNSSNTATTTTVTGVNGITITVSPAIYASSNTSFTSTSPCLNVASVLNGVVNIGDTVVIGTSPSISPLGSTSCTAVTGITTYPLSAFNKGIVTDIKSTKLIASAAPTYGRLRVGDSFTVNGTTTTISSLNSLNGLTAGTYILNSAAGPSSGTLTISSSNLVINQTISSNNLVIKHKTATDFLLAALYKGDGTTTVGANISAARTTETTVSPNYDYYPLSAAIPPPTNVPAGIIAAQWFTQGASGMAITVPLGTTVPTILPPILPTDKPTSTILAVFSGAGSLAANTTVSASPTPTATAFTISAAPTQALNEAQLCGGICALFNNPSSTTSTTQFTVENTTGTAQWAGGFTCLSGVDDKKIVPVTSAATSISNWSEPVK